MNRINCLICNLFVVLLSVLIFFILACNNEQPVQPQPEEPSPCDLPDELNTDILVPLAVGNTWRYEVTSFTGKKDSLTWSVADDTTLIFQGQTYEAAISGFELDNHKWFEANSKDGLHILGGISSSDTFVTNYLERKYPTEVGESWKAPRLAYHFGLENFYFSDTVLVTCIATDQNFETPAGIFQCFVYVYERPVEHSLKNDEIFNYYTPGVGRVGWAIRQKDSEFFISRAAIYQCYIR